MHRATIYYKPSEFIHPNFPVSLHKAISIHLGRPNGATYLHRWHPRTQLHPYRRQTQEHFHHPRLQIPSFPPPPRLRFHLHHPRLRQSPPRRCSQSLPHYWYHCLAASLPRLHPRGGVPQAASRLPPPHHCPRRMTLILAGPRHHPPRRYSASGTLGSGDPSAMHRYLHRCHRPRRSDCTHTGQAIEDSRVLPGTSTRHWSPWCWTG
mmetsp:Transcript_32561/g.59866  ORF Transcript_32561/g.59866 Transcript_32561/m.59866 type:complete len:207 (+) Transcript_32561:86-706(+)